MKIHFALLELLQLSEELK